METDHTFMLSLLTQVTPSLTPQELQIAAPHDADPSPRPAHRLNRGLKDPILVMAGQIRFRIQKNGRAIPQGKSDLLRPLRPRQQARGIKRDGRLRPIR